jgi:hypothetical protein
MKKIIKKLTLILGSAMIMSTAVFASETLSNQKAAIINEDVTVIKTTEVSPHNNGNLPSLRSEQHLDDVYQSKTDYDESFQCTPDEGNTLNIYVENRGDNPVNFKVFRDGESMGTVTVPARSHKTRTFNNPNGVHEEFRVLVSSSSGDMLNLKVEARQFEE